MKIERIQFPDEVIIEEDGGKFIFARPSRLDQYDYPDAFNAQLDGEDIARVIGRRAKLLRHKLIKIDATYEDGKAISVKDWWDLPVELHMKLISEYYTRISEYFSPTGAEAKKEVSRSDVLDSSENVS